MSRPSYNEYSDQLQQIVQQPAEDPLREAFDQRLRLGAGSLLERDEPNYLSILILTYDEYEDQPQVQERMRRSAADLFSAYLRQPDPDLKLLKMAADLVASFEPQEDPIQMARFADELMGFLHTRFEYSFDQLFRLDGHPMQLACSLIDLWAATLVYESDPQADSANPAVAKHLIKELFRKMVEHVHDGNNRLDSNFGHLLFIVFKANMIVNPLWMNKRGIQMMLKTLERLKLTHLFDEWAAVCRQYELIYEFHPDWAEAFDGPLAEYTTTADIIQLSDYSKPHSSPTLATKQRAITS